MKTIYAFSLAAGMASLAAVPSSAAEMMQEKPAGAMQPAMGERAAMPHFKPTGKPPSAARGEQVFVDHCAICHGLHGKGDGPRSAFFQPGVQFIPDLTLAEYLKGRDKQLHESIRQGLPRLEYPALVMPQFKYILSEEEIRSVLAYVKTFPGKESGNMSKDAKMNGGMKKGDMGSMGDMKK